MSRVQEAAIIANDILWPRPTCLGQISAWPVLVMSVNMAAGWELANEAADICVVPRVKVAKAAIKKRRSDKRKISKFSRQQAACAVRVCDQMEPHGTCNIRCSLPSAVTNGKHAHI